MKNKKEIEEIRAIVLRVTVCVALFFAGVRIYKHIRPLALVGVEERTLPILILLVSLCISFYFPYNRLTDIKLKIPKIIKRITLISLLGITMLGLAIISYLVFYEVITFADYQRNIVLLVFGSSFFFLGFSFFYRDEKKHFSLNYLSSLILVTMFLSSIPASIESLSFGWMALTPLTLGVLIIASPYLRFDGLKYFDVFWILLLSDASFWFIFNKFEKLGVVRLLLAANTALLVGALSYMLVEEETEENGREIEESKISSPPEKNISHENSFFSHKKRAIILLLLILLTSLAAWLYVSQSKKVLVVDKTDFKLALDNLPASEEDALSMAKEIVIEHYNVSDFDRYFTLKNISKTSFKWKIVFSMEENPDIIVILAKRITEEEGFGIADSFIINHTGEVYFNEHFIRKAFNGYRAIYTYIPWSNSTYNMNTWVELDDERNIVKHNMLLYPQDVKVSKKAALNIARAEGIVDPVSCSLKLVKGRIYWRCISKKQATAEDYERQLVYGLDLDATSGEVVRRHRYTKIGKTLVEELVKKIEMFNAIKDGSIINLYISRSYSEKFHIIKNQGRAIVKVGFSKDADITLYIERDVFLNALKSDDPEKLIIEKSKENLVTARAEKNPVVLARKGYTSLFRKIASQ